MAIAVTCYAGFGGFLFGYISGVKTMKGWLAVLGNTIDANGGKWITSGRDSITTSIMSVETFVGSLLVFSVGDVVGRRFGIIVFLMLFAIGIACQTGATDFSTFVVGRVFAGRGVGGTSCLVPMYQAVRPSQHPRSRCWWIPEGSHH